MAGRNPHGGQLMGVEVLGVGLEKEDKERWT